MTLTQQETVIHCFRQDLRLHDNPALLAASLEGKVLPVYILDRESCFDLRGKEEPTASDWWLHHSLQALNRSLRGNLRIYQGNYTDILLQLAKKHRCKKVFWNRCYEPQQISLYTQVRNTLYEQGIEVRSFNGSLLWEPWEVCKGDGTPYKVFTPFYHKGCLQAPPPRKPLPPPKISLVEQPPSQTDDEGIDALGLLPKIRWDKKLSSHWEVGEEGALKSLSVFLKKPILDYTKQRDFPATGGSSRLSPRLHFGELSPQQIWHAALALGNSPEVEEFLRQLGWREFSYSLLYHNPTLATENLQKKFNPFPWRTPSGDDALLRWQKGKTGIPIVDAGMRELWKTGYMHNRVRMITASFLVKNLLIDWREGAAWFEKCLVDADLANNRAGWQWVAGCGADAAPYFRIFNPVTQGKKFDLDGEYTRQYVTELQNLPKTHLFNPWEAPKDLLKQADIELGHTYPRPIVDLKESRTRALDALHSLKENP